MRGRLSIRRVVPDPGGDGEDRLAGEVVLDLGEVGRMDQRQVVQDQRRLEAGGLVQDEAGGGADGGGGAGYGLGDRVRVGGGAGFADRAQRLGTCACGGHLAGPGTQGLLGGVPSAAREKGLREGERGAPLLGREVPVATGEGEPGPSSRTVGTPTISTPKFRSRTMRRIRASCWASFCPNSAASGRVRCNSLATTVSIPSK